MHVYNIMRLSKFEKLEKSFKCRKYINNCYATIRDGKASFKFTFWQQLRFLLRPPAPPAGFKPPPRGEVIATKLIGGAAFFWIFYMFRKEGSVYLVFNKGLEGSGVRECRG